MQEAGGCEYVPTGHVVTVYVQAAAPFSLYDPGLQGVQAEVLPGDHEPASQATQKREPGSGYSPEGQASMHCCDEGVKNG